MYDVEKQMHVANKVLLCVEEEFEGMGTRLEVFGLSSLDLRNTVQRIPKMTLEEMFSAGMQREICSRKCQKLNKGQQDALFTIMKPIHDSTHLQRLFFTNVRENILIEALLSAFRELGKIDLALHLLV